MGPSVSREIEQIREQVIKMATLVEEAVAASIDSLLSSDTEKAQTVIANDGRINTLEMAIDQAIFETLALKAPVASDLRFLFSVQKMDKDLERIGDHAVNIAQAAVNCISYDFKVKITPLETMFTLTKGMLSDAITSFVNDDSQLALKVMELDDQVDDLNKVMSREVIKLVKQDVNSAEVWLEMLRVSKNLERIADLSTNIAEDVIFHAKATDVKHHHIENH